MYIRLKNTIKKNLMWTVIYLISSSALLFSFSHMVIKILNYNNLNSKLDADIRDWSIEKNKNKFNVYAQVEYTIQDNFFLNSVLIITFQNVYAAEDYINSSKKNRVEIYYNSKNPNYVSYVKNFPNREVVYFFISATILLYFIFFKRYISKYYTL
ncbi:MAG: hypothetical protein A3F40_00100 [Chlamydiae bacterium RIFCSPHIGHO2_12_FULL_27_8]|nr:MAG: hypothetical protein A3F40_00100 [Chlamydiae bacterium RIFCSPHIGHO2_12_FULL_27_8]